jgi:hypothetical protein
VDHNKADTENIFNSSNCVKGNSNYTMPRKRGPEASSQDTKEKKTAVLKKNNIIDLEFCNTTTGKNNLTRLGLTDFFKPSYDKYDRKKNILTLGEQKNLGNNTIQFTQPVILQRIENVFAGRKKANQ